MLFIRTSRGCEYLGLALPTRYRQRRRRACSARARPLAALFAVFCGRLLAGLLEITAAQRSKPRACQAFHLWSGPRGLQLTRNMGRYSLWSPRWADRSVEATRKPRSPYARHCVLAGHVSRIATAPRPGDTA